MPEVHSHRPVDAFRESFHLFYSLGAGVELGMRGSPLRVRVDVPLVLSDPGASVGDSQERVDVRWTVTVSGGG